MAEHPEPMKMSSVPVPDPTVLTTAALLREVDSLRERTSHDNKLLRELIEARLNGNDQAVALLRTTTDKIPAAIAEAVAALQELHEEKFNSIGIQFKERDVRTDQTSRDSKVAVDAALKAQQEAFAEQNKSSALAISKSEGATTKQIDLIGGNIAALSKSIDDKFNDIKERVTQIEARTAGISQQRTESALTNTQSTTNVANLFGIAFGAAGFLVAAIALFLRH